MAGQPDVYIETSVISYLAARPSRDVLAAARQQITLEWWHKRRHGFDVYVSELVRLEARAGDETAAANRSDCMAGIPELPVTEEARGLARALLQEGVLPENAVADALHIATAAVHGVRYLVTWNCAHIANAEIKPLVRSVCAVHGYSSPEICTPEELMGETRDD